MTDTKPKYQAYELVAEYLKGEATPEEIKAVDNLETQFGFPLDSAVIEQSNKKPISIKEGVEKHDVSKLVCIRHKGLYVYVEQRTLTAIDGKLYKRVKG
jgi:hypothetical protein